MPGESPSSPWSSSPGPTLSEHQRGKTLPVEEALAIARQLCDGLEAAHDRGVVHRDLKPANIKLRADGTVKILDFGLAKALSESDGNEEAAADSPTVLSPATDAGVILGTAAYMSPEQARGRVVDKRTDIWAFGCVLYEMLAGRAAFAGETTTDILAAVIRSEPDWSKLPAGVPVRIDRAPAALSAVAAQRSAARHWRRPVRDRSRTCVPAPIVPPKHPLRPRP